MLPWVQTFVNGPHKDHSIHADFSSLDYTDEAYRRSNGAKDGEAALRDFLHRHGTSMEAIEHNTIRISWPFDDGEPACFLPGPVQKKNSFHMAVSRLSLSDHVK